MTQTPIAKAIEQLSQYRDTYNPMCDEFTMIDNCVDKLTDLLPYEREVIERSHIIGQKLIIDSVVESFPNFDFTTTINEVQKGLIEGDVKATDYFTKTFTNNAD